MLKLKILDFFKKTNVNYWYNHFKSLNFTSREEIVKFQNNKLRQLIDYSYQNVPYYNQLFKKNNILPHEINSVSDLHKLPILDRDIIRDNIDNLKSIKVKDSDLFESSSSGTTGIPILYYKDKKGISAGIASGYILWEVRGWKPGDKSLHIWGNATSIKRWNTPQSKIKNKIFNQLNIASSLLDNDQGISDSLKKIVKFKPQFIDGYPSSIYSIADYINRNNISIKKVKQVYTTAENLEFYQKIIIEKHLGPTSDLYGSGEILGIGIKPANDQKYYIYDPHVILEAVDSGIPGMKDVIITDLDNYGMPFIRYKIGDMIDDVYEPDESCVLPFKYFNTLIGRSSDIITLPNGKKFHPVNIFGGTLFRKYKNISRHKTIWNSKKLIFVFEVSNLFDDTLLRAEIDEILKDYEVLYEIQYTDKILPSKSGKYKYVEIIEN